MVVGVGSEPWRLSVMYPLMMIYHHYTRMQAKPMARGYYRLNLLIHPIPAFSVRIVLLTIHTGFLKYTFVLLPCVPPDTIVRFKYRYSWLCLHLLVYGYQSTFILDINNIIVVEYLCLLQQRFRTRRGAYKPHWERPVSHSRVGHFWVYPVPFPSSRIQQPKIASVSSFPRCWSNKNPSGPTGEQFNL